MALSEQGAKMDVQRSSVRTAAEAAVKNLVQFCLLTPVFSALSYVLACCTFIFLISLVFSNPGIFLSVISIWVPIDDCRRAFLVEDAGLYRFVVLVLSDLAGVLYAAWCMGLLSESEDSPKEPKDPDTQGHFNSY